MNSLKHSQANSKHSCYAVENQEEWARRMQALQSVMVYTIAIDLNFMLAQQVDLDSRGDPHVFG